MSENKVYYLLDHSKFDRIMAAKNIPPGAKLVLFILVKCLGGKNFCWPSQKWLAGSVGLSERQLRNHLALLETINAIKIKRGGFSNQKGSSISSNLYDLSNILIRKEKSEYE
jgi:hypothetical protein